MVDGETFGAHVRRLRIAAGLNQTEFASQLGVEQGTVSRWESGASPSFENVALLATYADVRGLEFRFMNEVVRKAALEEMKKILPFVKIVGTLEDDDLVTMKTAKELEKAEEIEAPARSTPQTKAILVNTGELLPLVPVRSVIYFHDAAAAPDKFEGKEPLLVFFKNKTVRLGRLMPAPNRKYYFLGQRLPWLTDLVESARPVLGIRFRQ